MLSAQKIISTLSSHNKKQQLTVMRTYLLAALLLFFSSPTCLWAGAMEMLDDVELAQVSGQALVEVVKTIGDGSTKGQSGITFTRIRMGIKASVNANIDLIELGNYPIPCDTHYGDGSANAACKPQDVLIRNATLGCVSTADGDCSAADRVFEVTRPYIEFAYKNDGTPSRELVGLRLGAENIDGWLGGDIYSLSGDVYGSGCLLGICASGEAHEARGDTLRIVGLIDIAYTTIHRLKLTNTKNFYIGLQKENLNYPKLNGGIQAMAKPGFWMNLQDGVTIDPADVLTGTRMDNCWKTGSTFC